MADPSENDEADAPAVPPAKQGAGVGKPSAPAITPEQLRVVRWVLPVLWLVGVLVAGKLAGIQLAFLVLAGGVLVLLITLLWVSVQSLTGGATLGFEEALGMGAPSKVEEEKRAVLRALKDLDYERGVGKISPEDYAELSAKYRAQAKRLIEQVDETLEPAREEVLRVLDRRLAREGVSRPAAPEPVEAEEAAKPASKAKAEELEAKPVVEPKEPEEAET